MELEHSFVNILTSTHFYIYIQTRFNITEVGQELGRIIQSREDSDASSIRRRNP